MYLFQVQSVHHREYCTLLLFFITHIKYIYLKTKQKNFQFKKEAQPIEGKIKYTSCFGYTFSQTIGRQHKCNIITKNTKFQLLTTPPN